MEKIKILHIITGLGGGGAEVFLLELIKNLNSIDVQSIVISLGSKDKLIPRFSDKKIEVYKLGLDKQHINIFRNFCLIANIIKQNEIETIHAHMFHSLIFSLFIKAYIPKVRIIFTLHSSKTKLSRGLVLFATKTLRSYDIIFSEKDTHYFNRKSRLIVIPNGIQLPLERKTYRKYEKFTIISVGRLEAVKNPFMQIEIAKKLRESIDFNFFIVGDGNLANKLQTLIEADDLQGNVFLLGYRADVIELCSKSHVFINTSKREGMPISILEAGLSGIPIIATPVGVVKEMLENDGYLAEDTNAFVEEILFVKNNYEQALIKANNFYKKIIDLYDIKQVSEKYKKLYITVK